MENNFLEIKDLSFSYPDGTVVLKDVNFSIKQGEFVGILGGNGTGKTTLLKLLNRLLKPTNGLIYLQGKDVNKMPKSIFFTRVCTMFQNPDDQLFAPTVKEDVAFGPTNMGLNKQQLQERVENALEAVEMSAYADKSIHTLSFGQKKRACLAGVLAMSADVMLLDEPTSCLDPMGVHNIMRLLRNLNCRQKITMIMATHSVDLVPLFADKVIVLDGNQIACLGTPEEVFAQASLLRKVNLRLPRIGHLFEILKHKDGLAVANLPLTIGAARKELQPLISERTAQ